ncbi:hypothetical protein [Streptomyces sp. MMS24-I29]|uniref:hypothetical protein n=1 Tax=Streptomyces sp. MMS24-I29 TaxID=3351480 RepID=UPI003C7C59AF
MDLGTTPDPRAIRGRDLVTGAVIGIARITHSHQDPDGTAGKSGYQNRRDGVRATRTGDVVVSEARFWATDWEYHG